MDTIITALEGLPRWALMWLLAVAVFFTAKAAVWFMSPKPRAGRPLWMTLAWWLAWPGMSTSGWSRAARREQDAGTGHEHLHLWIAGGCNILVGAGLLWGVARMFTHPLAAGWVGMAGFIFLFHFGFFHLVTAFWRTVGIPAKPVMRNPLASTSLAEFWGQRWNTAFRDVSHRVLFMPLARRWGEAAALWVVFAISGLVHEVVITVPAGGVYGLPTAYFLLQAAGLVLERRYCTLAPGLRRIRTILFTALPAFILFPPPFVERVMVPFFTVIGALP